MPTWAELTDEVAPPDRPVDEPFYIIFRGTTYRRTPNDNTLPPADLAKAREAWNAGYYSAGEVARRKARKSAMRRPPPANDSERRVEQRRADPEQQAVDLGALAHHHPPFLLTPRTFPRASPAQTSASRPDACPERVLYSNAFVLPSAAASLR